MWQVPGRDYSEDVGTTPIKVRKHVPTPAFVIWNGWRDEAYMGPDRCQECLGWGTRNTVLQDEKIIYRTCPSCKGMGRS